MATATQSEASKGPRFLQPVLSRPNLFVAAVFGVLVYCVAAFWMDRTVTRALIGWNSFVLLFLLLSFHFMWDVNHERLKQRAIAHDEGRHLILLLTILASIASIGALVAELSLAKGNPGGELRLMLAAGTVVLSWLFVQVVFAIHYAHVYYLGEETGDYQKGLEFGDHAEPDYWDFVHFSIVMGATAQTADIVIRSKEMRRIGTVHTLVAFGFNTAILATMINLAANLF
jgi:uncharacterized membrane protein